MVRHTKILHTKKSYKKNHNTIYIHYNMSYHIRPQTQRNIRKKIKNQNKKEKTQQTHTNMKKINTTMYVKFCVFVFVFLCCIVFVVGGCCWWFLFVVFGGCFAIF